MYAMQEHIDDTTPTRTRPRSMRMSQRTSKLGHDDFGLVQDWSGKDCIEHVPGNAYKIIWRRSTRSTTRRRRRRTSGDPEERTRIAQAATRTIFAQAAPKHKIGQTTVKTREERRTTRNFAKIIKH